MRFATPSPSDEAEQPAKAPSEAWLCAQARGSQSFAVDESTEWNGGSGSTPRRDQEQSCPIDLSWLGCAGSLRLTQRAGGGSASRHSPAPPDGTTPSGLARISPPCRIVGEGSLTGKRQESGDRRQGSAEGFAPRMGSRHGRQGWLSEPSARRRSLTSLSRRTVAENQCATGILAVGISNPKSRAGMPVPHCKGTNVPPASLPVIFPAETA